jgi:hypothetical protein
MLEDGLLAPTLGTSNDLRGVDKDILRASVSKA